MLRAAIILLSLGGTALAGPLPECPVEKPIVVGARTAADLNTTYTVPGEPLRVCVDRANYPYGGPGKGHRMMACMVVANGARSERLCGTANEVFVVRHRHRIMVSLRKPRFGASVDVWLQIDRVP